MINTGKNTDYPAKHQMVAGVNPHDHNIEFVGIPETKKVIWLSHGNSHYFKDLSEEHYKLLEQKYLSDTSAKEYISPLFNSLSECVEYYTYLLYGELDTIPDIKDGRLSPSENFRDTEDCISLNFKFKDITIGDVILNRRDIKIIDMIKKSYPNKLIAAELGITLPTLDFHLRNLYKKADVYTKLELLNKINQEKI